MSKTKVPSCCASSGAPQKKTHRLYMVGVVADCCCVVYIGGWVSRCYCPVPDYIGYGGYGCGNGITNVVGCGCGYGVYWRIIQSTVRICVVHTGQGGDGIWAVAGNWGGGIIGFVFPWYFNGSGKIVPTGASAGQVIAFLLASPWNSFSLTLILIAIIGFKWTMIFIVLSMAIGLITGYIFDKLVACGMVPSNPNTVQIEENFNFWTESKAGLKRTEFNTALFKDMIYTGIRDSKIVVRWLLFGILLAGALRVLMNPEQFESFFGPTALGLLITILVATVLEVCSEGSTPISADIMTRANAPGNSFAFLMAGVATDYTEIMILKDTTKKLAIAIVYPIDNRTADCRRIVDNKLFWLIIAVATACDAVALWCRAGVSACCILLHEVQENQH